ncbi:zincin [Lojkania enalia]|uniref:Zincin n=1 Tax=Lojkania enalia TaxID=147567 RepID=A0A9P4JZK7_9PLEO|nr:zincin [Didymosphaeria enalia]
MKVFASIVVSSLLGLAKLANSISTNVLPSPVWQAGEYTIHETCNASQTFQLRRGLYDMMLLAEHAKAHILEHGNSSEIYVKYFGAAPSNEPAGWYDRVINANRSDVLFRCDDPDQNCATQDGWGGHWRGSNATQETVICPLSFQLRRYLEGICSFGYTVAGSPTNFYWGSDLLHRVFHVPRISLGLVEHYTESYEEVLALAIEDPSLSIIDSDALQYFALEVFSYIVFPGEGCPGEAPVPTPAPAPSSTASAAPSQTSSASDSCHTHADGFVHC